MAASVASSDEGGRGRRKPSLSDGSDDDAVVVRGRRQDRPRPDSSDREASLGSEAMSESEPEAEPDTVDVTKIYLLEGKFKDHADRARIMAMTEVEREAILADRAREMERYIQNQHLRQMLQRRKGENASILGVGTGGKKRKRRGGASPGLRDGRDYDDDDRDHYRKGGDDEDDSYGRSSSDEDRRRGQGRSKPEEFRRLRQRHEGRDRGWDRRGRGFSRSRSRSRSRSSRGGESGSDDGYRRGFADNKGGIDRDQYSDYSDGPYTPNRRPDRSSPLPATASLDDFEKVRVGRSQFGQVCFYPTFEELITGCFCRVVARVDERTEENVYEMGRIEGFVEEGEPYPLQGPSQTFMTNYRVILSIGKKEKQCELRMCSNSRFTEAEFDEWKNTCLADKIKLPLPSHLQTKLEDIKKLRSHTWTNAEINTKLQRQQKFSYADYLKKTKTAEGRIGGVADSHPTADSSANADGQEGAIGLGAGGSTNDTVDRLSKLNESNRETNRKMAIQAYIQQRRQMLKRGDKAAAAAAAAAATAVGNDSSPANGHTQSSGLVGSEEGLATAATATAAGPSAHVKARLLQKDKTAVPSVTRMRTDDEMIGELDLDIDVVI